MFFEPIVGSPEFTAGFGDDLRHAIRMNDRLDPFDGLDLGALHVLDHTRKGMPADTPEEEAYNTTLYIAGTVGMGLTIAATRAVGKLYARQAKTPQRLANVRKNVSAAVSHTYRIALMDMEHAVRHSWADKLGLSPRNPIVPIYAQLAAISPFHGPPRLQMRPAIGVSPRTFRSSLDEAGQLKITPRYHRPATPLTNGNRYCPSVDVRVPSQEGRGSRSALVLFMKTIGEVAITDIYPRYFDIIND